MAEERIPETSERSEEDPSEQQSPNTGCSKFSRMGTDQSVSSWLASKEEKRSKATSTGQPRRSGLSRGKLLKKTTLNKVSKKQKKKNSEYKKAKKVHYASEENRACFLCGCENNLSVHHKEKRGNSIADEETFVTLCLIGNFMDLKYPDSNHSHQGGCHSWIEANKSWAREYGLL